MASPAPFEQNQSAQTGQKRKRDDDELNIEAEGILEGENAQIDEEAQEGGDSNSDTDNLIPDDYIPEDENEMDRDDDNDSDADVDENNANHPTHDEPEEPFPPCAIFDDGMEEVEDEFVSIPQRILELLSDRDCSGKSLKGHLNKIKALKELTATQRIRIAILGGAGAGKSSLLNAVTGKPDLSKSAKYQAAFAKQTLDFGAVIQYLDPKPIRALLEETVRDYNTFAFEADDDWDEDTFTTAKKANENAFRVLRTLFNDLPDFKTKAAAKGSLASANEQGNPESFLNMLVENCEFKLKYTARNAYSEYHEARTVNRLRSIIDPLMTSTGTFDRPALWPLARQVRIGVRGSRVLDNVVLIDLPGISDTNQTRVELTHDKIKTCDYVWIVSPIARIVDDSTLYQLLSRYGKAFKGMVCVIATHSDEGILGSETKLVNHLKQEDQDVGPYTTFGDQMKAKKSEITQLNGKVTATKKRKRSTKQQMLNVRGEEETLKEMRQDLAKITALRFEFLVKARNALITEQLQEMSQSHMPRGQTLHVYCVSNYHYAGLTGGTVEGPRLPAETTGIPKLRADTLALMAPRLLDRLEHYAHFSVQAMLKDLQLWLNGTSTDRRPELLELARRPQANLDAAVENRLNTFAKEIQASADGVLQPAILEAPQSALKQLAKKKQKHPATIMAFIRKGGNYATKMCPKECWNENFAKYFADVVVKSEASLTQSRVLLTAELEHGIVADLTKFSKDIEDFPAPLPKAELASSIQTYTGGVRHAFTSDEESYTKELRNVLLDVTQDNEKNAFGEKMGYVYRKCNQDSGPGVTKRSIQRIEDFLSNDGKNSAFAVVARKVTEKFVATDKRHMTKRVQNSVDRILHQLHTSVDELLDNRVVDEAEQEAKAALQEILPELLSSWEQGSAGLQAVKAKY